MIKKEILIFLFILSIGASYFLHISLLEYLLILAFLTYIFLSLYKKNRHIGLPALLAVFTVLVTLYVFGLIGNCHLCSTKKDGIIFFCNNIFDLAPLAYDKQLGDKQCTKELVWVWPPKSQIPID